jgi:SMI1-KNR4 cell-wall
MNKYDQRVKELDGRFSRALQIKQPLSLKETELMWLEGILCHRLPTDYGEFVRDFGGFRFPLFDFYGVIPGETLDLICMHLHYHRREVLPDELAPIAVGGGGNHLVMSLAGENLGVIYFWIADEATVPPSYDNCEFVAASFDDLMQSDYLLGPPN